jgi:hypothetical protein
VGFRYFYRYIIFIHRYNISKMFSCIFKIPEKNQKKFRYYIDL